jgi:hypothetical protein
MRHPRENVVCMLHEEHIVALEAEVAWLRRADSLADVSASMFAELRNLFTPISNAVHFLSGTLQGERAALANQAAEATGAAARLLRHAIEYLHQLAPDDDLLEPAEVVAELRALLHSLLGERRPLVIVREDPRGSMANVDRIALERVLLNLACDAREKGDGEGLTLTTSLVTLVRRPEPSHAIPEPGEYLAIRARRSGPASLQLEDLTYSSSLRTVQAVAQERGWGFFLDPGENGTTVTLLLPRAEPVAKGPPDPLR